MPPNEDRTLGDGSIECEIKGGKINTVRTRVGPYPHLATALFCGGEDAHNAVQLAVNSGHTIRAVREQCLDEIAREKLYWFGIASVLQQEFYDTYDAAKHYKKSRNPRVSNAVYERLFDTAHMSCGSGDVLEFDKREKKNFVKLARSAIKNAKTLKGMMVTHRPDALRLYEKCWFVRMDAEFEAAKREEIGHD